MHSCVETLRGLDFNVLGMGGGGGFRLEILVRGMGFLSYEGECEESAELG